jgi:hypothetical protein
MTMESIKEKKQALAVFISAPENIECQKFEVVIQQALQQFAGKIELLQHPVVAANDAILRELFVLETPTLVVFNHGRELARLVGAQPLETVEGLFEMAVRAQKPGGLHLLPFDRLVRLMVGTAIIFFGYMEEQSWILMGLGVILMLTAFIDQYAGLYQKWSDWKSSHFRR